MASGDPTRRWAWLVLSVLMSAVAIGALFALSDRENEARAKEQVARLSATRLQQTISVLAPIGATLLAQDPRALDQLVQRSGLDAAVQVDRLRSVDPARAGELSRLFQRVMQTNKAGRIDDPIAAFELASRAERLAIEIADRQRDRAELAGRQSLYGGVCALILAVLVTAALLRRERSVSVSAARLHAREVQHLADHDNLTGLPNRRRLDQELEALTDPSAGPVEIAVCDLNDFKDINDGLGHHAGDSLLMTVARDLQTAVGDDGTVFRVGGDEFCIVSHPGRRVGGAARRALEREGRTTIGSVGAASWPADHEMVTGAIRVADRRMYEVKRAIRRDSSHTTQA